MLEIVTVAWMCRWVRLECNKLNSKFWFKKIKKKKREDNWAVLNSTEFCYKKFHLSIHMQMIKIFSKFIPKGDRRNQSQLLFKTSGNSFIWRKEILSGCEWNLRIFYMFYEQLEICFVFTFCTTQKIFFHSWERIHPVFCWMSWRCWCKSFELTFLWMSD